MPHENQHNLTNRGSPELERHGPERVILYDSYLGSGRGPSATKCDGLYGAGGSEGQAADHQSRQLVTSPVIEG